MSYDCTELCGQAFSNSAHSCLSLYFFVVIFYLVLQHILLYLWILDISGHAFNIFVKTIQVTSITGVSCFLKIHKS